MKIILDSTQINTKTDLYDQLNSFLHFPDYFGYNLDALHDILTEIDEPITLEIINSPCLKETLGETFYKNMLQVFEASAARIFLISVKVLRTNSETEQG